MARVINTESDATVYDELRTIVYNTLNYCQRSAFSAFMQVTMSEDSDELIEIAEHYYYECCRLDVHMLFHPVPVSVYERCDGYRMIMIIFRWIISHFWSPLYSTCGLFYFVNILTAHCISLGGPYEMYLMSHILTMVLLIQVAGSIEFGHLSAAGQGKNIIAHCVEAVNMLLSTYEMWTCNGKV